MQVLILDDDPAFQAQLARAMMGQGFNVLCVDTVPGAEAFLRLGMVDVLIAAERIGGKLSHAVALLAECRNPLLAAILRTDRTGADLDELFDLVPAVVGILGRAVAPSLVMQVVLAATAEVRSGSASSVLAARWAAAQKAAQTAGPEGDLGDDLADDHSDATGDDPAPGDDLAGVAAGTDPVAVPADDPAGAIAAAAFLAPVPLAAVGPVALPAAGATSGPLGIAARAWDGLWPARVPAITGDAIPAIPAAASQPPAAAALPDMAMPAPTPAAAPPAPASAPARSLRPSPDSALARVMAAGGRALARAAEPAGTGDVAAITRPRGPGLQAWLGAGSAVAGRSLSRAEPAHPAAAAASRPERRLHLA